METPLQALQILQQEALALEQELIQARKLELFLQNIDTIPSTFYSR